MATARLDIGGGIVKRTIVTAGGERIAIGTVLSAEDLGKFNLSNLRSMVKNGIVQTWPTAAVSGKSAAAVGQRHIVAREDGKFDVIQGEIVNTKPLSRKIAEKMVAQGKN